MTTDEVKQIIEDERGKLISLKARIKSNLWKSECDKAIGDLGIADIVSGSAAFGEPMPQTAMNAINEARRARLRIEDALRSTTEDADTS